MATPPIPAHKKATCHISVDLDNAATSNVIVSLHDGSGGEVNTFPDMTAEELDELRARYEINEWQLVGEKTIKGRRVYTYQRPLDGPRYPALKSKTKKASWMNAP